MCAPPLQDRPLLAQFCANDPDTLLAAARLVEGYVDGVDLNLGCPQRIAKRGKYGERRGRGEGRCGAEGRGTARPQCTPRRHREGCAGCLRARE